MDAIGKNNKQWPCVGGTVLIAPRTNNSILLTVRCTRRAFSPNCSVWFLLIFAARFQSELVGCWNGAAGGKIHLYLDYLFPFSLQHLVEKQSIASLALNVTEPHETSMPWMSMSHTIAVLVCLRCFLETQLGSCCSLGVSVATGCFCLVALPPRGLLPWATWSKPGPKHSIYPLSITGNRERGHEGNQLPFQKLPRSFSSHWPEHHHITPPTFKGIWNIKSLFG